MNDRRLLSDDKTIGVIQQESNGNTGTVGVLYHVICFSSGSWWSFRRMPRNDLGRGTFQVAFNLSRRLILTTSVRRKHRGFAVSSPKDPVTRIFGAVGGSWFVSS